MRKNTNRKKATPGKSPALSLTTKTEVVCPNDTNPMGILQGGRMLQWMDIAAAICAQRHAEKICVTASIDSVKFNCPVRIGDIVTITAVVEKAFTTSMRILVTATAMNPVSRETHHVNEAVFTFVALDDRGRPVAVPALGAG